MMFMPSLQPRFPRFAATLQGWLAGLTLTAGLISGGLSLPATATEAPAAMRQSALATAARTVTATSLPNGVYLYGQASQPEQLGQAYFVFEVRQGKVVGALYMPRSSFDCTYGQFESDRVALTVVNSYEKMAHPFAIALQRNASVATTGNPMTQLNLEGFQRLTQLSDNDHRILNICKQNYQKNVW